MTDGVHIRLTLTRGVKITSGMDPRLNQAGPTLIVLPEHKPPVYDKSGITLITSSVRRTAAGLPGPEDPPQQPADLDPGQDRGERAGADDAVMLDHRGFVAETNATHMFFVAGGRAAHADHRGLPGGHHPGRGAGTGRGRRDRGRGRRLQPDPAVQRADEMFVTGTMGGIAPVISIDGRTIGTGEPGPVTATADRPARRADRHDRNPGHLTAGECDRCDDRLSK